MTSFAQRDGEAIQLVGFDGDDTLWKSEDYYRSAEADFEAILADYLDLGDSRMQQHLLAVERRNLKVFGYGAKGMTLSMIETAIELTQASIAARDIQRIVEIGRATLQHPVEVIAGVREAVSAIAADYAVVLITKGDLFHQEQKIEQSGLADLFPRVEVVSEKDPKTYARVLGEFDLPAQRFVMIGNSLRSDVEPVLAIGGWGIYTPVRGDLGARAGARRGRRRATDARSARCGRLACGGAGAGCTGPAARAKLKAANKITADATGGHAEVP